MSYQLNLLGSVIPPAGSPGMLGHSPDGLLFAQLQGLAGSFRVYSFDGASYAEVASLLPVPTSRFQMFSAARDGKSFVIMDQNPLNLWQTRLQQYAFNGALITHLATGPFVAPYIGYPLLTKNSVIDTSTGGVIRTWKPGDLSLYEQSTHSSWPTWIDSADDGVLVQVHTAGVTTYTDKSYALGGGGPVAIEDWPNPGNEYYHTVRVLTPGRFILIGETDTTALDTGITLYTYAPSAGTGITLVSQLVLPGTSGYVSMASAKLDGPDTFNGLYFITTGDIGAGGGGLYVYRYKDGVWTFLTSRYDDPSALGGFDIDNVIINDVIHVSDMFAFKAYSLTQTISPVGLPSDEALGTPHVTLLTRSAFEEQLDTDIENVFYNTDEFARAIMYQYASGATQQLDVIFDEESSSIDMATEAPVIVSEPMFHCGTRDFQHTPGKGDRCRIKERWFYVKEVHPDSTGVTVVTLRRD